MESLLIPTGQPAGLPGRAVLTSTFQTLQLPGVMKGGQREALALAPGSAQAATSPSHVAPVDITGAQVVSTNAPVVSPSTPVVSPSAPVVSPSAPVGSASAPGASPSAQVVNSGEPVINSGEPVVNSGESVTSPDSPFVSPAAPAGASDSSLYPRSLLESVDLTLSPAIFRPQLSVAQPGESLLVRPLAREDFSRGFLQLLGQLTTVGDVSREAWDTRFDRMAAAGGVYMVTVIEDVGTGQVREESERIQY